MTPKEAIEKLDHTLCLNSNEGNLKFSIDIYEESSCDCKNLNEMVECIEIIKQFINENIDLNREFILNQNNCVCPICGGPMDETYRGTHMCWKCEQEIKT